MLIQGGELLSPSLARTCDAGHQPLECYCQVFGSLKYNSAVEIAVLTVHSTYVYVTYILILRIYMHVCVCSVYTYMCIHSWFRVCFAEILRS